MTKYLVFSEEQIEAAIDEMASSIIHGGSMTRRALGDPKITLEGPTLNIYDGLMFDKLRTMNVQRCTKWHEGAEPWVISDWTNAMCGEAGEAANVAKKIRRILTNTPKHRDTEVDVSFLEDKLMEELADTVIYADLAAAFLKRDLGEAIRRKFNATSEEFDFEERL